MDQSKTKNDPYPPPSCRNNYVVKADLCYDDLLIPCIHLAPQIWMMLLHIPARLTLLVPLAVLTRKDDFYECAMIVLRRLPQREGLDNNIAAEEMQADFILRSVLKAMYPNHPELIKLSIASRPATSVPRGAMLSSASGGGSSNKQLGNVTSVSFDQPVSETYSDSKANVPLLSNTSIISSV
ncbi:hypothetical protein RRG08_050298 [Elysia crispata]|uniref:Uncharacterized protein n=1 Tax=Elysia crispata TaxID=231223 RepID=A0AAE0ZYN6_9GAST|nr:hypothetical protein RRG08_050298 [Elysia crispata]